MINCGNRTLLVLSHEISILIHDIIQACCVFYPYTVYMILLIITMIMGYSKHELSTKKHVVLPKKIVI